MKLICVNRTLKRNLKSVVCTPKWMCVCVFDLQLEAKRWSMCSILVGVRGGSQKKKTQQVLVHGELLP